MSSQADTAVMIVDHGSRRAASNEMLLQAVDNFRQQTDYEIVEAAHMELAEPDIATAFQNCVRRGATRVIVFPYFLSPGRHWSEDIPDLVGKAAESHPDVEWIVTAPFGLHSLMTRIIEDRIQFCLKQSASTTTREHCDVCDDDTACRRTRGKGADRHVE